MKVKLIDITERPVEKIYRSYRICYSKDNFEDIKIPSIDGHPDIEKMINFIKPLVRLGHTSPLEHVSFSFSIEGLSRAALAQLTRHRTFKFNVQSQRYVDGVAFEKVLPSLSYLEDEERKVVLNTLENHFEVAKETYRELVTLGVKKEDARAVLPQSTTCNLVVTCDLHNFRNFLRQRLCAEAQEEIRTLANEMVNEVIDHVPFAKHEVMICDKCKKCSK